MLLTDWQADGQTGGDLREEQTSTGKIARLLTWKINRSIACFEFFKNWRSTYQLLLASWSCKSLDPAIAARRQCMWIRAEANRASERACGSSAEENERQGASERRQDRWEGTSERTLRVCQGPMSGPSFEVPSSRRKGRWELGRWFCGCGYVVGPRFWDPNFVYVLGESYLLPVVGGSLNFVKNRRFRFLK
jgi:hypothetical protein